MTKSLCRDGAWKRAATLLSSALLATLAAGFAGHARATGYFGPFEFLSDGSRLAETPEFYWDTEVKRLARDFHPKEKPALVPRTLSGEDGTVDTAPMQKATEDADAADFADALKTGAIKPPDPKVAQTQHADARDAVQVTGTDAAQPPPSEFDSEFADYDRGAFAFRRSQWDAARKAWLALLDRPAAERHYRSVWAAFMLGKLALKTGDASAVQWFRKTRDLAAQGFGDSLGMAADSYGWEGRSEWKQGHRREAAQLFLTQLSLGDESAVVSLKALIPDRDEIDGMLNYDDDVPVPQGQGDPNSPPPTDAQKAALETKLKADLAVMAADPLLRKLETVHILATESGGQELDYGRNSTERSRRWLGVIEAARLGKMEDAEYLGWVAYTIGNYKEAQHWLDLSNGTGPVADWLRSRLELRAGNAKGAAESMAAAWDILRDPAAYAGWDGTAGEGSIYVYGSEGGDFSMSQWASGELGAVRLLRSDFVQALDTLLKGGLRDDAAYVAERVLTANELKAYVDRMPPPPATPKPENAGHFNEPFPVDDTTWLRYLLGRRLVREDRYADAEPYMPPGYAKLLAKYTEALKNGADGKLTKAARADNWSTAAWLARYDGMELMGTEVAPDGYDSDGDFQDTDLAAMRLAGKYSAYDGNGNTVMRPLPVPAAKSEIERLKVDVIRPDVRYHYRVIAAALAIRAAALMEDNTEELADAANTAGQWVTDRDDKLADRFYGIIEKRCTKTKIGKDAIAKRWFVDETGPWSEALKTQCDGLEKQFGIRVTE